MSAYAAEKTFEVVLVEDSVTDTRMVGKALERGIATRKRNIVSCLDGEQALGYLHSRTAGSLPDLVILDLNLPGKDGWEVLAECKQDPTLRSVPIVVFTSSQLERDVKRCYELGANSFVAKPFEYGAFLRAVLSIEHYWLGLSASPQC